MTVGEIIEEVKWCIDHETREDSKLSDGGEDTYMDNIIRAKINDALRWVAVMTGKCTSVKTKKDTDATTAKTLTVESYIDDIGVATLPDGIAAADIRRVRIDGWHKAAVPVDDTSDDALLMFDEAVKGSQDRPLATIMRGSELKILVQPWETGNEVEVAYVGTGNVIDNTSDSTSVYVSDTNKNAFIYYIAYLLLAAYEDAGAQTMLSIAVQSLGINTQK